MDLVEGMVSPSWVTARKVLKKQLRYAVFRFSHHRCCMRHFYANFCQHSFKGDRLRDLLWATLRACIQFDCIATMEELTRINPRAKEYKDKEDHRNWSCAFFLFLFFSDWLPCNVNQNNFMESFNKMIMDAWSMPIFFMFEWIRRKLMDNMQKRARKWNGDLCPKVKTVLR